MAIPAGGFPAPGGGIPAPAGGIPAPAGGLPAEAPPKNDKEKLEYKHRIHRKLLLVVELQLLQQLLLGRTFYMQIQDIKFGL